MAATIITVIATTIIISCCFTLQPPCLCLPMVAPGFSFVEAPWQVFQVRPTPPAAPGITIQNLPVPETFVNGSSCRQDWARQTELSWDFSQRFLKQELTFCQKGWKPTAAGASRVGRGTQRHHCCPWIQPDLKLAYPWT